MKNDILNKVFENNIEESINSENDEIYKTNSINRNIKLLDNNKRELQSNKLLLWKGVLFLFFYFLWVRYRFL